MSSSNRKPYATATVLDQALLNLSADNLLCQLEAVVDIETPTGWIYASNRNKFVGGTFYEALLNFPEIVRTLGDWLAPALEFSELKLELGNADGRFNNFLPGGADFAGWIGKLVEVKIGLRDVESTYFRIFRGRITQVGGFGRTTKSLLLTARDEYDRLSQQFPTEVLGQTAFPNLDDGLVGTIIPVIYGDWTTDVDTGGSVPSYAVNGKDPTVNGSTSSVTNVQMLTAANTLTVFDTANVFLKRGDLLVKFTTADIVSVSGDKRTFQIRQGAGGGTTVVDGNPYAYEQGDEILVRVKGKDLGAYDDNIVWQARDILMTYGGLSSGDFDANWATFRDKATPSASAIASIKSRCWIQEQTSVIQYALSLLEQVRLEAFITRDFTFKLSSLHLEDFVASPSFSLRNWDVEKDSFTPVLDEQNNFNRAQGAYNFWPSRGENAYQTSVYRNTAAITQAGKGIYRKIVFPNLFVASDVANQTQEILRLASSYLEIIDVGVTWRALLLEPGSFLKANVQIGSSLFSDVPCLVRQVGYDPNGLKLKLKLWSLQMTPFPGYTPGFQGTVGGSTAVITAE